MARLTTFSKLLITMVIVGLIAFALLTLGKNKDLLNKIVPQEKAKQELPDGIMTGDSKKGETKTGTSGTSGSSRDGDVVKVGVVTWGGYAAGQYFNEGFKANKNSRFYKDYGFEVEFKVLDDFDASRNAWKADEVDLLWATIDAFPTESAGLAEYEPQVVFQADWSRGGDAVVARRGIESVADLKGKKVAVAPMTPSHTFLLWLLDAGDLSYKDISIVEVPNAIDAASAFKAGKVDAAVVWSPDDIIAVREVPGAKVLENTKTASNIIADVFFAKKSYIERNEKKMQQLFEGWMKGAAEINSSEQNKAKAGKILGDGFGLSQQDGIDMINNVRLCTYGDNENFFKINTDYKGVTGEDLYTKMSDVYNKLNFAPANVPNWRLVSNSSLVRATKLSGQEHAAEGVKVFTKPTVAVETAPALATKKVRINFRTGEYQLDENTKYIIDREFADIAKLFGNARIRIEGNTDNVGSASTNRALSLKRAQSAADYLQKEYGMSANRFVIVGNGPDKPVADNSTKEGKAKNRRTDFVLVKE